MSTPAFRWPPDVDVSIDSLAQGGAGVGRWQARPVFVAGALPGEQIRAKLVERREGWARGHLVELLGNPAPERITPPCPVFGTCGGCDWQYHTDGSQQVAKAAILTAQLQHVGRLSDLAVLPTAAAQPWAYRTTARFHIAGDGVGFYAAASHDVVDLEACPLLDERLNTALGRLRPLLPWAGLNEVTLRVSSTSGQIHAHLDGRGSAEWRTQARRWQAADPMISGISSASRNGWMMLAGTPYLEETMGDVRLRISPTSFFQANVERARAVLAELQTRLHLTPQSRLLDAFCGVGTFVLPLARHVGQAWGIEEHPAAISDAQSSAQQQTISNTTLLTGRVETLIGTLAAPLDVVILDPPRRGVDERALKALLDHQPAQIAYVSCHPGTLARDVRTLIAGGYTLQSAQPFDFFPQSSHIESLVILQHGVD